MVDVAEILKPVESEMERVAEGIRETLSSSHDYVNDLALGSVRCGGKMLRPAVTLLAGRFTGRLTESHIKAGIAAELLHNATLIHDDVIDEAELRRKETSVNMRWGNQISVVLGDFVFTRASALIARSGSIEALQILFDAASTMCEGELLQLYRRNVLDMSEEEYLKIVSMKTASLFSACCQFGTLFSGADGRSATALLNYGLKFGIAFQIIDDCLDIIGEEKSVGKSLGTDLNNGKLTLPAIRLMNTVPAGERDEVGRLLLAEKTPDRRAEITGLLREYGAIDYSFETARTYSQQAKSEIAGIAKPGQPDGLMALADFIIDRNW